MGPIGLQEMMGIFLIALLLFGPKKLPELGRTLGKGLREFRKAKDELRTTFETHMRELERETRMAELTAKSTPSVNPYPAISNYPYPYEESVATGPALDAASSLAAPAPVPQIDAPVVGSAPHVHEVALAPAFNEVTPAPAVNGAVPRSSSIAPTSAPAEQEHPA